MTSEFWEHCSVGLRNGKHYMARRKMSSSASKLNPVYRASLILLILIARSPLSSNPLLICCISSASLIAAGVPSLWFRVVRAILPYLPVYSVRWRRLVAVRWSIAPIASVPPGTIRKMSGQMPIRTCASITTWRQRAITWGNRMRTA